MPALDAHAYRATQIYARLMRMKAGRRKQLLFAIRRRAAHAKDERLPDYARMARFYNRAAVTPRFAVSAAS